MNWSQVGTIVATFAPTLGSLLGGLIPLPGGSILGQTIGNAIAKQFGVPATPEAVARAIQSNPDELVKARLAAATEELKNQNETLRAIFETEALLISKGLSEVNATMRVEVLPENRHWFFTGWRPACGWVFVCMAAAFGVLITGATIKAIAGDAVPLQHMTSAWPVYLAYFGALGAMVGVYVIGRTQEKTNRIVTK